MVLTGPDGAEQHPVLSRARAPPGPDAAATGPEPSASGPEASTTEPDVSDDGQHPVLSEPGVGPFGV